MEIKVSPNVIVLHLFHPPGVAEIFPGSDFVRLRVLHLVLTPDDGVAVFVRRRFADVPAELFQPLATGTTSARLHREHSGALTSRISGVSYITVE